jgi:hypothetical protein
MEWVIVLKHNISVLDHAESRILFSATMAHRGDVATLTSYSTNSAHSSNQLNFRHPQICRKEQASEASSYLKESDGPHSADEVVAASYLAPDVPGQVYIQLCVANTTSPLSLLVGKTDVTTHL